MKIRTQLKSGAACYTVQSGDSLSTISQRFYGTQSAYPKILLPTLQTVGPNANVIRAGKKLYIPD